MPQQRPAESDLYAPIKKYLESLGYEVKGEVLAADIVAVRRVDDDGFEEQPIIIELKTGFSLTLVHQAIERQKITDTVYVAVPRGKGKLFQKSLKNNKMLCRRLGLGLITVRLKDGFVEAHVDPVPYKPRKSKPRKARLLREFAKRMGDPNIGGSTRTKLITAYRQDAIRCAQYLDEYGPTKAAIVAKQTGAENARNIMADNHYGWFERVNTGIYGLTKEGEIQLPLTPQLEDNTKF